MINNVHSVSKWTVKTLCILHAHWFYSKMAADMYIVIILTAYCKWLRNNIYSCPQTTPSVWKRVGGHLEQFLGQVYSDYIPCDSNPKLKFPCLADSATYQTIYLSYTSYPTLIFQGSIPKELANEIHNSVTGCDWPWLLVRLPCLHTPMNLHNKCSLGMLVATTRCKATWGCRACLGCASVQHQ